MHTKQPDTRHQRHYSLCCKPVSLRPYHTFGMEVLAHRFYPITNLHELADVLGAEKEPFLVLGGGSNVLFLGDVQQPILHNQMKGVSVSGEEGDQVLVCAGGGENWHDLVVWAVERGFGGLENLSLIPGTVGAAPVQNIGAYGVELKDVFHSLKAIDLHTGQSVTFLPADCCFGYRHSIFKEPANKGRYFIYEVSFLLQKRNHRLHTSYGQIEEMLRTTGIQEPTIADVSKAVIAIRQSKLPDPKEIGNAGSFFKNPEIPLEQFQKLKEKHQNIVCYPVTDTTVKVPAGWLIEQCGWKGKRLGAVGVHARQSLVLVHYGGGTGYELLELAKQIQMHVFEVFGIQIVPEVNIVS